ncbi:hypothetical protein Q5752_004102 [Cryptotrichosporon argae]
MASQAEFDAASAWLVGQPAAAGLANETKLELYGLFKVLRTGAATGPRPAFYAFEARAKYDAWAAASGRYADDGAGARGRYVEIARGVGWDGRGDADEDEVDLERLDEGDEGAGSSARGGMGVKVSVMADDERRSGQATIHDAVADGDAAAVAALLAAAPASANAVDEFGYTPLHVAADRGHEAIVRLLLAAGADKSCTDEDGQTPLELARVSGRDAIVALLS